MDIDKLIAHLQAYQSEQVFNQYQETHPELDLPGAAQIRCHNLGVYLRTFREAHYVLVGEAAGYAGCRFSGIPFTSEAQLVGLSRLSWARDPKLLRSSRAARPWAERSAAIVWQALNGRGDCLLWNAFPWHPWGTRGPLSNRHPGRGLTQGLDLLADVLRLFPDARPYAVGRFAQRALGRLGISAPYIRHPSHGGSRAFAAGIADLSRRDTRA